MRTINVLRLLSPNTNTIHPDSGKMHPLTFVIWRECLSQACGGVCARVSITFIITYIWFTFILIDAPLKTSHVIAKPKNSGCAVGRARTLLALSGSQDNKSIDCPSPVGAKCKYIEKDRGQNTLERKTDIFHRGQVFVAASALTRSAYSSYISMKNIQNEKRIQIHFLFLPPPPQKTNKKKRASALQ